MKSFFVLLTVSVFLSSPLNAQSFDPEEGENFWARYIEPILQHDIDQVIDQSAFPIATIEGDVTEKGFHDFFEIMFDELTLESLSEMDYTSIEVIEGEEFRTCTIAIMTFFEMDEEYFESATILSFRQENGDWKLFQIDIAG